MEHGQGDHSQGDDADRPALRWLEHETGDRVVSHMMVERGGGPWWGVAVAVLLVAVLLGVPTLAGRSAGERAHTPAGVDPNGTTSSSGEPAVRGGSTTSRSVVSGDLETFENGPDEDIGTTTTTTAHPTTSTTYAETTTTIDPLVLAARSDLKITIDPEVASIKVGDRLHVTFTVTNTSRWTYPLQQRCGRVIAAALEWHNEVGPFGVDLWPFVGDAFSGGMEPTRAGMQKIAKSSIPSGDYYYQYFSFDDPPCVETRSTQPLPLGPGQSMHSTGWVETDLGGSSQTLLRDIEASVGVATEAYERDVATKRTIIQTGDQRYGSSWPKATQNFASSSEVIAWLTRRAASKAFEFGGAYVYSGFRDGAWVFRISPEPMDENRLPPDFELVVTTERDTGDVIDVRELRDGYESSLDPDATHIDPSKETVLFHKA